MKVSSTSIQVCRSAYIPYFKINTPIFYCLFVYKEYLNPQVRINKIGNEHTVDYHPSPSKLTLYFMMLKNGQTYFKNLAVFTQQDFLIMFGHFSTLWNRGLTSRIHPFSLIFLWTPKRFISPEYFLKFFSNLYIYPTIHGCGRQAPPLDEGGAREEGMDNHFFWNRTFLPRMFFWNFALVAFSKAFKTFLIPAFPYSWC